VKGRKRTEKEKKITMKLKVEKKIGNSGNPCCLRFCADLSGNCYFVLPLTGSWRMDNYGSLDLGHEKNGEKRE